MTDKLMALFFGDDEGTKHTRYYFKSWLLLMIGIVLITDHFFNIEGDIRFLIGENMLKIIPALRVIGYCLITLLVISTVSAVLFWIMDSIFYKLNDVSYSKNRAEWEEEFFRVHIGSKSRAVDSFDWLLIIAILLYMIDNNYLLIWGKNVPTLVFYLFLAFAFLRFLTCYLIGIKNQFFRLRETHRSVMQEPATGFTEETASN